MQLKGIAGLHSKQTQCRQSMRPLSMTISESVSPTPDRAAELAARAAMVLEEIRERYPDGPCAALPPVDTKRLQVSIRDYAGALRETGETLDQVVKQTRFLVARAMREVELRPGCLMDLAATWAIEGYHRRATARVDHSVRQYGRHVDESHDLANGTTGARR